MALVSFPKAQNLTNMLKKRGVETDEHLGMSVGGIKPAYEPILWAVKPPDGSYVENVLKWGVGAVNVDECRVGLEGYGKGGGSKVGSGNKDNQNPTSYYFGEGIVKPSHPKGRFPANVILSHHPECVRRGVREGWDCVDDCPVKMLDKQSGDKPSHFSSRPINTKIYGGNALLESKTKNDNLSQYTDSGGASRFFPQLNYSEDEIIRFKYQAKASRSERNAGLDNSVSISIIKIWKEKNITKQEKLVQLLVDTDKLPLRVIGVSGTKNKNVIEWSMSWFGKNLTAQYQKDFASIISTETSLITPLRIYNWLHFLFTNEYTEDVNLGEINGGNHAGTVENSIQLTLTISEKMAFRLGVENVVSKMQLKISVKEGRNIHPTCKPISLFEWLIKLVTREGQVVLDPFLGSGTTLMACEKSSRKGIGIEKEVEYIKIAKERIKNFSYQKTFDFPSKV